MCSSDLVFKKVGDRVEAGEPLARLHHAGRGVEEARALLASAFAVGDFAVPRPLLRGRVG